MKCEVCGQAVRIYSGKEGTNSYEPMEAEYLRAAERVVFSLLKIKRANG